MDKAKDAKIFEENGFVESGDIFGRRLESSDKGYAIKIAVFWAGDRYIASVEDYRIWSNGDEEYLNTYHYSYKSAKRLINGLRNNYEFFNF